MQDYMIGARVKRCWSKKVRGIVLGYEQKKTVLACHCATCTCKKVNPCYGMIRVRVETGALEGSVVIDIAENWSPVD